MSSGSDTSGFALRYAAFPVLLFVCVTLFRLHEAYPFLLPLRLSLVLGGLSMLALVVAPLQRQRGEGYARSKWFAPSMLCAVVAAVLGAVLDPSGGVALTRILLLAVAGFASAALYCGVLCLEERTGQPGGAALWLYVKLFVAVSFGLALAQDPGLAYWIWSDMQCKMAATVLAVLWYLRERHHFHLVSIFVVGSGALIAAVAIYNGIFGIDLVEGSRVGIGRSMFAQGGVTQLEGRLDQAGSLIGDPNDLALVLLLPFGLALATAVNGDVRKGLRRLSFVAVPMITLAIVYTQSRGGALGMLVVVGTVMSSFFKSRLFVGVVVGVGAVLLFFAMAIGDRQSGGSSEWADGGIDESASGRLHTWQAAVNMAVANPLSGVGLGNYMSQYRQYTPVWSGMIKAVHSTWFGMLAEAGLPGLVLFVMLVWRLFRGLIDSTETIRLAPELRSLEALRLGLLAALAGFCVSASFLTHHFSWPFYTQMGLVVALVRYVSSQRGRNSIVPVASNGWGARV